MTHSKVLSTEINIVSANGEKNITIHTEGTLTLYEIYHAVNSVVESENIKLRDRV